MEKPITTNVDVPPKAWAQIEDDRKDTIVQNRYIQSSLFSVLFIFPPVFIACFTIVKRVSTKIKYSQVCNPRAIKCIIPRIYQHRICWFRFA